MSISLISPAKSVLRRRNADVLPCKDNTAPDMDNLDDLLQYIGNSSPECLSDPDRSLNDISTSDYLEDGLEKDIVTAVLNQRNVEKVITVSACTCSQSPERCLF